MLGTEHQICSNVRQAKEMPQQQDSGRAQMTDNIRQHQNLVVVKTWKLSRQTASKLYDPTGSAKMSSNSTCKSRSIYSVQCFFFLQSQTPKQTVLTLSMIAHSIKQNNYKNVKLMHLIHIHVVNRISSTQLWKGEGVKEVQIPTLHPQQALPPLPLSQANKNPSRTSPGKKILNLHLTQFYLTFIISLRLVIMKLKRWYVSVYKCMYISFRNIEH